jgi:uncharacterized repeat protein (TIGR01451 family)
MTVQKQFLWIMILLLPILPSYVGAEEKLDRVSTVFNQVSIKADGKRDRKPVASLSEVKPGEEIVAVLTYRNNGTKPVQNLPLTDPIPNGLQYLSASISKSSMGLSANLSVSVNGGKTYGELSRLTVPVTHEEPRPAEQKEVTHVRWIITSDIAPGEEIYVSLRTQMK